MILASSLPTVRVALRLAGVKRYEYDCGETHRIANALVIRCCRGALASYQDPILQPNAWKVPGKYDRGNRRAEQQRAVASRPPGTVCFWTISPGAASCRR